MNNAAENKIKIQVVLGSTRDGRFGDKPAQWVLDMAKKREGVEAELVDLRDYPLPYFNEPVSPAMSGGKYTNEIAAKLAKKIGEADAYIMMSPEYNHSFSAAIKNALDYVYGEWNRKPVAFVGWGGVGGARAIEHLRQVVVELQMAPMRNAVYIQWPAYLAIAGGGDAAKEAFASMESGANNLLDQLVWWAKALKAARGAAAEIK